MIGQTPPRPRPNHHLKGPREPDTGPSSHKFRSHSPVFRRSEPPLHHQPFSSASSPLNQEIALLERKKVRFMMSRQYSKAQQMDKRIRWSRQVIAEREVREIVGVQKQERRSISEAHRRQMAYLHTEWQRYFRQLDQREHLIFRSFQKEQIHSHMAAEAAIRKRCSSLSTSSSRINELQQQEKLLRRSQAFDHLRTVKTMLAEARKERRKRRETVAKYVQLYQDRLRTAYSKKYEVLVSRLEEYRRDKERIYLREQRRLRQKYKNVMQQLKHDQALEMQQTSHFFISTHQY